ncbi:hypothetical protein [Azospirillum sp. SYSU D00513]|uniref:hypothetical protein n=1 Tax=Azospirillum sp. SYSU D00513 TaxID=2812561 RepID=UPI001A95F338|nr:hypothetical protein [Azospirillum sp. SYSU D00513]
MTDERKDHAVEQDQRAMQPGVGGPDRPMPDDGALDQSDAQPAGRSVEDGQTELQPEIDRPKPDAGDATL